jgi:hypothetical protein
VPAAEDQHHDPGRDERPLACLEGRRDGGVLDGFTGVAGVLRSRVFRCDGNEAAGNPGVVVPLRRDLDEVVRRGRQGQR